MRGIINYLIDIKFNNKIKILGGIMELILMKMVLCVIL